MTKYSSFVSLAALELEPAAATPLYRQLYDQMRDAILSRRLAAGARLPPTRALAEELGVSRNTIVSAFEQLTAEGYVEGRVGSGTYVAAALPDEALRVPPPSRLAASPRRPGGLSKRGLAIAASTIVASPQDSKPRPFRPGLPALDAFPLDIWARLHARHWRYADRNLLAYGDSAGYAPLREAIAEYLGASRGVRCTAEQVLMVAGSQQAVDLAARLLLDAGDAAWVEDPGYPDARHALAGAGARLVPVPVDAEGLDVRAAVARAPKPRMVYVSPSHQFPLGVTMSLARRLALLDFAQRTGAWILEDDYDSEYRYTGRPLAALQGLDSGGRVIYIGTFSEVMFPSLRLGYVVVPPELMPTFSKARALADRHSPLVEQAVLNDFIREGHFARHIRRMRVMYGAQQAMLVNEVQHELDGRLQITSTPAGMHLVGWLPRGVDDRAVSEALGEQLIEAPPLSAYALSTLKRGGLVLGYAGISPKQVRDGVRSMKSVLGHL